MNWVNVFKNLAKFIKTTLPFLYNFGEVPIVDNLLEKCTWICKYLQYRHVFFYYSE